MKALFIGGCDRSGTTMLGSLLGTHSKILCVPESQFIYRVFLKIDFKAYDIIDVYNRIRKEFSYGLWGISNHGERNIFEKIEKKIIESYAELIQVIVEQYSYDKLGKLLDIFVDHTPSNLRYAFVYEKLFPESAFIHIVRDIRAVASSWKNLDWGPNNVFFISKEWAENIAIGLSAENYFTQKRIMRLYYEDLVQDPVSQLRAVCKFLNLNFEETMVSGIGFDVHAFNTKTHILVGQPPDRSRSDCWKSKLGKREVEIIEYEVGELLCFHGYELINNTVYEKRTTRIEKIFFLLHEYLFRILINPIRLHLRRMKYGFLKH
jgi:hypothetical protein